MKELQLSHVTEIKVSYQTAAVLMDRPKITSSKDAENIFRSNWSENIELWEEFNVLFLNQANHVKGIFRASQGGISGTVVDLKIIFAAALKGMASALVLAHNHPSTNLEPSQADIDLTKKILQAGHFLDLRIIDHLILAPHWGYYSFSDAGRLHL